MRTNYAAVKRMLLEAFDTPEKMAKLLAGGIDLHELDDVIAKMYCDPKKRGCNDPKMLEEDGGGWHCDECILEWLKKCVPRTEKQKERAHEYYLQNKDRHREWRSNWRKNNPEKMKESNHKQYLKRKKKLIKGVVREEHDEREKNSD